MMRLHFSKHAAGCDFPRRSNDRAPDEAGTFGCSSRRPCLRPWLGGLGSHILTETMEGRPDIGLDSYDRLFPNQDTLASGRIRKPDRLAAAEASRASRATASFSMTISCRGPTSGRFSRACAGSVGRRLKGSSRRPNDAVAFSACGCRRRTTMTTSRGRRRRRVGARRRRSSASCRRTLELVLGNQIYIAKEGLHPGLQEPAAPPGRISESRVLQGAGNAAVHVRQAARHRLCRGSRASRRPAARMPRRRSADADPTSAFAQPFAMSDARAGPGSRASEESCGPSRRPPQRRCSRTTQACWRPRRPSARQSSPPGSSPSAA